MLCYYLGIFVVLHHIVIGYEHNLLISKLFKNHNFGDRHPRQLNPLRGFNWGESNAANTDDIIIFDDNFDFNSRNRESSTTQRPTPGLSLEIPGMGTTRSPCEDACLITPEYNPVCADDGTTYFSIRRLKCAQSCGKRVRMIHAGACTRRPDTPIGG